MLIGLAIGLFGGLVAVTIILAWVGGMLWLFNWAERRMDDMR